MATKLSGVLDVIFYLSYFNRKNRTEMGKMRIIICLDDNNGMLFNNRRQGKDKKVIEDIGRLISEHKLYINEFSRELFKDQDVVIQDNFLEICAEEDYCFVENVDLSKFKEKISSIIIYRWNRTYPYDMCFNTQLLSSYRLNSVYEFVGNSHDKIRREIYTQ